MSHSLLLYDLGLTIVASAVVGFIFFLLRLPLVLAYLLAGILIGPHLGFGLIQDDRVIKTFSEIGLILLMFILGLEISLKKLLHAGKPVLINGITQFVGCALLATAFFKIFGARQGHGNFDLVYFAIAASLSSTLVVVKILSDRLELDSLTSRITLGILVMQDAWAIIFLALQPNLSQIAWSGVALSGFKAILLLGVAAAMSHFVLPSIFSKVGKKPELLLVMALSWCFGISSLAGEFELSKEMGALIAGLAIASYPYHIDIAAKISSIRDFFVTLFFVALGLQIPMPTAETLRWAFLITGFALVSRVVLVFPVLYRLGYGNRASLIPGLNLSQVSEFSLVLVTLGSQYGHVSPQLLNSFTLALVFSFLTSSWMIPQGYWIYKTLNPLLKAMGLKDKIVRDREVVSEVFVPKIVLLGFYREASSLLAELISRHSAEIKSQILIVDYDPESHHKLLKGGYRCEYGDISNPDTLRHLGLEQAELILCTIPDIILKGTTNLKLVRKLRAVAPNAQIVLTGDTYEQTQSMYDAGASYVCLPRVIVAHYLADVIESLRSGRTQQIREGALDFLKTRKEVL